MRERMPEGSKALRDCAGERLLLALSPLGVSTAEGLTGLQPLDALVLDSSEKAEVIAAGEKAAFYLVEITPA